MRKSVKIIVASTLATAIAACVGFYVMWGREFELVIPEERIQQTLESRFPIDKTHLLVFTIRYEHPHVRLDPSSKRVHLSLDAQAQFALNNKKCSGTAEASGSIAYDRNVGSFYFIDAKIERIIIAGIPDKYTQVVNEIATATIRDYLNHKPVYKLNPADVKQSLAKLALKRIAVRDHSMIATMGIGP